MGRLQPALLFAGRIMMLKCGRFELDMRQPHIMAIINMTPDSFSGDGLRGRLDQALKKAEKALEDGAAMLDLGGESTRPGSDPVSEQEELDRLMPLIERLADGPLPLSIDTVKAGVMKAAIAAGAAMINDINAFHAPGALEAVVDSDVGLCVMHMQGQPRSMQANPEYQDVVAEVADYLHERAWQLQQAGVAAERIVVDPGFGFGKTVEHNYRLLHELESVGGDLYPVLAGLSRKTMLGAVTGRAPAQRVVASAAAAVLAVQQGARIVRVHDVAETRDALKIWSAFAEVPFCPPVEKSVC